MKNVILRDFDHRSLDFQTNDYKYSLILSKLIQNVGNGFQNMVVRWFIGGRVVSQHFMINDKGRGGKQK